MQMLVELQTVEGIWKKQGRTRREKVKRESVMNELCLEDENE